jgi:hypothetical protein
MGVTLTDKIKISAAQGNTDTVTINENSQFRITRNNKNKYILSKRGVINKLWRFVTEIF